MDYRHNNVCCYELQEKGRWAPPVPRFYLFHMEFFCLMPIFLFIVSRSQTNPMVGRSLLLLPLLHSPSVCHCARIVGSFYIFFHNTAYNTMKVKWICQCVYNKQIVLQNIFIVDASFSVLQIDFGSILFPIFFFSSTSSWYSFSMKLEVERVAGRRRAVLENRLAWDRMLLTISTHWRLIIFMHFYSSWIDDETFPHAKKKREGSKHVAWFQSGLQYWILKLHTFSTFSLSRKPFSVVVRCEVEKLEDLLVNVQNCVGLMKHLRQVAMKRL